MKQWLRQHRYAINVTLRRLFLQPFSWLANTLVIALALTLPLIGVSILTSVQPLVREVSITPEMTIFIKPGAAPQVAVDIAQRIKEAKDGSVLSVKIVPKDTALSELSANPAWSQALKVLEGNPLPDAVVVSLVSSEQVVAQAQLLAQTWQSWADVDFVQLDSAWVQRLEALLRFGRIGLALITLVVSLVVLAAIFNTVRMQALSQREEIAVARLVGATESFVRRPFLYQGGLTCGLAACLSIGLCLWALTPLNQALLGLAKTYGAEFSLRLPDTDILLLCFIAAMTLGAISARWSVTRHTRF
jgi:cell division transport system permease protein